MEPSPLVYDTAAAAPCPAGACCPLPRRETDSEAMLGGLIAEGAALYACCRRCAVRAPRQSRQALEQLAREEQRAVRALRRVYVGEAVVQRGCADLAARMEDGCLRQLLAAEADRAAERGKRLANLLEKALTTENNLLKW